MFCPSCGAPNNERDQRYCRECGASLPVDDASTRSRAIVHRPSSVRDVPVGDLRRDPRSSALVPQGMRNKLMAGAIGAVVLLVVVYLAIKVLIATIAAMLPVVAVAVVGYLGFLYYRHSRRR